MRIPRRRPPDRPRRRALTGAVLAASLLLAVVAVAVIAQDRANLGDSPYLRIDPARTVLSERDARTPCGECHASEFEAWQESSHARGFNTMHRSATARDILRQMDLTVTKRQESLCMRCHYTVGPELNAIAGVSCESCHGPAADWLDVHNDWGDAVDAPDGESPEHRAQRIARSEAAGMLRPSGDLYAVAANCFECHTVPVEELVNTGGHRSGTNDFNLPERMAVIRHNFLHEQWGEAGGNRAPTAAQTRLMFVLGRMLSYEYTLRGLAEATTEEGSYYRSMHRRVVNARGGLEDVSRAVEIPAVSRVLELGQGAPLAPGRRDALLAVADRIRETGQGFARSDQHPDLAALDPLIEGRQVAAAAPPPGDATTASRAADAGNPGPGAASPDTAASDQAAPAPAGAGSRSAAAAPVPSLPGSIRSRPEWIAAPGRQYLGDDGECMGCHGEAEDWWYDDPHTGGHSRLTRMTDGRAVEIATLYGIGASGMVRADQICMNCHGTVLNAAIAQPVGCESCHGPAADYLDPHSDGGNPQLGMSALKDAEARAATCARCHHISDERLLTAGHPDGAGYDLAEASAAIRHWPDRRAARKRTGDYPEVGAGALAQAYGATTARRAIPRVTVAKLPSRPASRAPSPSSSPSASPSPSGSSAPARASSTRRAARPAGVAASSQPPRGPRTVPVTPTSAAASLDLEPLPAAIDSLSTEDLILLVKRRLERVHAALRGNGQGER